MRKVLVVGQTPPPYGGQAMMINRLVKARFEHISIIHLRMSFSDSFNEIGRSSFKKITHLFSLIIKVWKVRLFHRNIILYYPPAGPNFVPVMRDLIFLFFTRFLFSKKVYHFRAAGISEYLGTKGFFFQKMARLIYGKPNLAIQLSNLNPADGAYFSAKRVVYIPNGLEDEAGGSLKMTEKKTDRVSILFIGILKQDKGLSVLIEAVSLLMARGIKDIEVNILGEFASTDYRKQVMDHIKTANLEDIISFKGVVTGDAKFSILASADIFCFPSFFDSESFGNVLVEAMMFGLPVVATRWRGIPDIVTEETGYLVEIKNPEAVASKLEILIKEPHLRNRMGTAARKRYEEKYQLEAHLNLMEQALLSI